MKAVLRGYGTVGLLLVLAASAGPAHSAGLTDDPATCGNWIMPVVKRLPVRDQGSLGICYAETGAAMYDALLLKHHSRLSGLFHRTTDAYNVAFALHLSDTNTDPAEQGIAGGKACDVFDYLVENSGCSASINDMERIDPQKRGGVVEKLEHLWLKRKAPQAIQLADQVYRQLRGVANWSRLWDRTYRSGQDLLSAALRHDLQQGFVLAVTSPRCERQAYKGRFLYRGNRKLKNKFTCLR